MASKIKQLNGKHILIVMIILAFQVVMFSYITKMLTCSDDDIEGPIEETFSLNSIVYEKCAQRIKDTLELYYGIIKTDINVSTKEAKITYDPEVICRVHIDKLISSIGYNADEKMVEIKAFDGLDDCCKVKESLESCISKYKLSENKSCCSGEGTILRKK